MADQYVFELQFIGEKFKENQLVIIDGGSMGDFSKLKEALKKCMEEPFRVQYYDDEDDLISVDTEDEFKELAKLAKQRSARGMLMKLVLIPNNTTSQDQNWQFPIQSIANRLKSEIKQEILSEMKEQMAGASGSALKEATAEYEEDSDGNMVYIPEKRKVKLLYNLKRAEKKERHIEMKIGERLERLESKKRKLLERATSKVGCRKLVIDPKMDLPVIWSGIASYSSTSLPKKIAIGKEFAHLWHLFNDGTVPWTTVELRHTWSSPGLEPFVQAVETPVLQPGQDSLVTVRFRAPKTVGRFVSYWHLFYLKDSQWTQFGHYISVTGLTKLPKDAAGAETSHKKMKHDLINFSDEHAEAEGATKDDNLESKPNMICKMHMEASQKHLEASLASSQIAAEMAKEAARAALRRFVGTQASSNVNSSDNDKLTSKSLAEITETVENLNLCDSDSDCYLNMDTNGETDPGFVMVDIPSNDSQAENLQEKPTVLESVPVEEKEMNKMTMDENQKAQEPIPVMVNVKMATEKLIHSELKDGSAVPVQEKKDVEADVQSKVQKEPQIQRSHFPVDYFEKMKESQQPMSLPRLDPNVNYPVFPPPQPRISLVGPPPGIYAHYPYNLYQPQVSSSHPVVFPNPPMINFTNTKINHGVPFPQIPTYPPMPGSCHPMPLTSPAMHPPTALPPSPAINSSAGPMPFSHVNPPPIQHMIPSSSFPPVLAHRYEDEDGVPLNTPNPFMNPYNSDNKNPNIFTNYTNEPVRRQVPLVNNSSSPAAVTNPVLSSTATTPNTDNASAPAPVAASNLNSNGSATPAESTDRNKKPDGNVPILPQALVDGAINAASTAWNAWNNLRHKEGEAAEFDPKFENNMSLLTEMGFKNTERNARLLKQYNNDISQVIGIICMGGGTDNLNLD